MRLRNIAKLAAVPLLMVLAGCPKPPPLIRLEPTPAPISTPSPAPTPAPTPPPPPIPYVPSKRLDVGRIFNGMQIRTALQTEWGTTATRDREEPDSYSVDVQVHVKVPKPHHDLAELCRLNPQLPTVLPQLPALLDAGKISPFYDDLYRLKVAALQQSLMHLDGMLSRHNFYDCETVLELEHPVSRRRALLMQADMDTDNDGSDTDRVAEIDGSSETFAPFTSYKWPKRTALPNGFIIPRVTRLKQVEQDLAAPGISAARQQQLRSLHSQLKSEISDLQKYSYLLGGEDPYVVLPGSMFGRKFGAFAPAVGDYCVIIYEDMLLPAVIGDVGPNDLVGEASLRICRQISPKADANNRPVNDLKATYLIFPGSADKPFAVPDLDKWHARCDALLKDLGGYQGTLFAWEDRTKPKPPPATPSPTTPSPAVPSPAPPRPGAPPAVPPAPISPPAVTGAPAPAQPAAAAPSPAARPAGAPAQSPVPRSPAAPSATPGKPASSSPAPTPSPPNSSSPPKA